MPEFVYYNLTLEYFLSAIGKIGLTLRWLNGIIFAGN
jgi:hypothetical protein